MTSSGARPTLVLVLAVAVLFGCGVILLLERSLTRILLGVVLLGNGVNLLILLGGRPGG
ncbi:NADH-quinone oxidoreductase subunit K, partial [Micromonospora arida]